jgi:hypothetical protein
VIGLAKVRNEQVLKCCAGHQCFACKIGILSECRATECGERWWVKGALERGTAVVSEGLREQEKQIEVPIRGMCPRVTNNLALCEGAVPPSITWKAMRHWEAD